MTSNLLATQRMSMNHEISALISKVSDAQHRVKCQTCLHLFYSSPQYTHLLTSEFQARSSQTRLFSPVVPIPGPGVPQTLHILYVSLIKQT